MKNITGLKGARAKAEKLINQLEENGIFQKAARERLFQYDGTHSVDIEVKLKSIRKLNSNEQQSLAASYDRSVIIKVNKKTYFVGFDLEAQAPEPPIQKFTCNAYVYFP